MNIAARAVERAVRVPAWVAPLSLLATLAIVIHFNPLATLGVETQVDRRGAEALLSGGDALYAQSYGVPPFTYPPIAALFFLPLTLPVPVVSALLLGGGLAAMWRITRLVLDAARPHDPPGAHARLAGALILPIALCEPVYDTLAHGQINLFLAWLVAEDLLQLRRSRYAGCLIALATLVKLIPGVFFLVPMVAAALGDRRAPLTLVRGGVTLLAGVVAGFALMPRSSVVFWSGLTGVTARVGEDPAYFMNQSIVGALARWQVSSPLVWAVLVVIVIGVACVSVAAALRVDDHVAALVAAALCGLLVSPASWTHHWVWLWPLVVWGVTRRAASSAAGRALNVAVAGWVVVLFAHSLAWGVPHDSRWPGADWTVTLLASLYPLLATFTLVSLPGDLVSVAQASSGDEIEKGWGASYLEGIPPR